MPTVGITRGRWYFELEVLDFNKVSGLTPAQLREVHAAAAHSKMASLEQLKRAVSGDRASYTLAKTQLESDIQVGFVSMESVAGGTVGNVFS